jgi:sterol desaturase/sphingolipid hydroxylase (fatty acid hydroxylase superfamily)
LGDGRGMSEQEMVSAVRQGRYVIAAGLLAVFWTVESVAPMFGGRGQRVSHNAANLGLAAINAGVAFGFAFGILFVTEWARGRGFGLLNVVAMPVWVRWVAALVLLDCWQYWWHRLNHRVPILWRFHAVHHADAEMDASSGVRFHTVEMVFSFLARLVVLPLLGVTVPQLLVYEAVSLPIILFHHSNLKVSRGLDRGMRWLIVTPWMHVVHHSRERAETDSNYSSFLSVWDRMFGSFRLREKPEEIELGLEGWREEEWRGVLGMLAAPFRRGRGRGAGREKGDE